LNELRYLDINFVRSGEFSEVAFAKQASSLTQFLSQAKKLITYTINFDESKLFPKVKEHIAKMYCVKKMNQEIMETIYPLYCERMLTI
jgi:hypothetical protein